MRTLAVNRRQLLALGGAAILVKPVPARSHDGKVHVTIADMAFDPPRIEVRVGQTIEWINKDRFAHTATVKGKWEVMLRPGASGARVVEAGDDAEYYCRFHPNMKGRIVIVG